MKLSIVFPDNLKTEILLRHKNIPCFCRVAQEFEILFLDPLPSICGVVTEWEHRLLDERSPAGGGGVYKHYSFGMVSLEKIGADLYEIIDLSFFGESRGWCPILIGREYTAPGGYLEDVEDDIGRKPSKRKNKS